jgi:ketosteroid isomerase-like protein
MRWFESSHPSTIRASGRLLVCFFRVIPTYLAKAIDAFVQGDVVRAVDCFSEDAVYRELRRAPVRGRSAIASHFAEFAASGTAWRFVLEDVIVDANRACVTYVFTMSEGAGRPGRERAGCAIVHLDALGKIADWREYDG